MNWWAPTRRSKISLQSRKGVKRRSSPLCKLIRADLKAWREEPEVTASPKLKAERLGMSAASEKRIGIACLLLVGSKPIVPGEKKNWEKDGKKAYEAAREFYLAALEVEPQNHWVITQYLSIMATPVLANDVAFKALSINHGAWWIAARQVAQWQLNETAGESRVWALGDIG